MAHVNPLSAGFSDDLTPSSSPVRRPAAGALALAAPDVHSERAISWLNRAFPARMLDLAVRILRTAEGTRADARRGQQANATEHLRTQQLIQELGCMLDLTGRRHGLPSPGLPPDGVAALAGLPQATDAVCAADAAPSLEIYLLGPFSAFANDSPIEEWPNGKGKSVFKYLATHRGQPVPKEVLMEVFWPESDQEAARNNLNVAVYGLRKALARAHASYPFVLFRQGCYSFNPELRLWIDAEAFVDCVHRAQAADSHGDADSAVAAYRVAQAVYRRALLVDDRYDDWLIPQRQSLQDSYLKVLNHLASHDFAREAFESCTGVVTRMLEADNCNEEAHRLLMRCYSRMGHTHLALRQYHFCVEALSRELNLIPSPQTVALFQQIRQRQSI